MEKFAILVDAGYVWAQIQHMISNSDQSLMSLDLLKMRESLLEKSMGLFPSRELFRIYWYDGDVDTSLNLTFNRGAVNSKIAELNNFKLRLGTVNSKGQQKGVDGLIIADLISLAQNRCVSDVLLVSGDADLAPGVVAAQMLGIRVHQLEFGPKTATSPVLLREVDCGFSWPEKEIQTFIKLKQKSQFIKAQISSTTEKHLPEEFSDDVFKNVLKLIPNFLSDFDKQQLNTLQINDKIPVEIDKKILSFISGALKDTLSSEQVLYVRTFLKPNFDFEKVDNFFEGSLLTSEQICQALSVLTPEEKRSISQIPEGLPKEVDKKLLKEASRILGRPLSRQDKKALRMKARSKD